MPNENLVKLYTTLTTPNQALGGKAFFTPESLGGSADVFAEKLKDRANLDKLFTTITSPSDALGGKAFFTPESLGGNANVFAEKIGFGAEKKNLIGSESTSGLKPSQNTKATAPKVSIDGDVKNAIISLEGAQMALVNKDKEIANLDKSLAGGRDVGGSFLQVDRNLEKVVDGLDKKLAKERQFIQKSVESTIVKVKPVLNKVINEKINDATIGNFTRDVGGKIVPDETKISSYADEIIKQTGLSEGKYVKDFIYNEVKANVSNKLTQPKIEKVFNELYKKKYGVSVEEDINKDFVDKFKDVNAVKAQAEVKLNTVKELAKTDFTNEMSVVSNEFKAKADVFNSNYKQTTEQINKQAEVLNAQYQSGAIPKEQYSAGITQLNSSLEASFKAYKGNFDQMADEFLKTQNAVASRYDKRLRRQYNEIDKAAKVEIENRLAKYKSQYKISPEIESRYSKTYQEAAEKFKKQEGVIDYQIDKSKGAAVILGQSLLSGLGQGIKGLSYMADFELGKVYGEYLENSFRLSESNLESMKDLLDPIKVARSSGQTIGAMAPMLAGNALIASATAGTSIPVQLAATGGFGFFMESMQMAGDMYDRKMQETGIVADAEKAAAKVIQANTMLLPLYAFDGLPLISNATLGIKNRALRGLAKGGIEMATEITQEVPQSAFEDVIYKNKSLTDVIDKFDVTKKENRDEIFNTVLNVVPSSFLMGSAPTFLGYANKPIAEIRGRAAFAKEQLEGLTDNAMEQFFYDMQLTKGITFSKAFLSAAYSSGQVNEMQLIKLTNIVDKSAKVLEDAKELKLNNGESKVYAAYEFAADAYTKQAEAMEDGVAKEALLAKAAVIKKQAVNYLNTKEGDYVVLVLPNGEQYVYQPDFFTSSVSNYNTLKNLLAKKLATAQVVSSTKEGDKVKAKIMSYVRILDSAPENIEEFTEEEGGMSPKIQSQLDEIAVEIGELEISLEQPSLSPESKQKIEARLSELDKIAQELLAGNQSVEYVSEGDNFFKILLDGTKEPVTEAEFDQAVSTPKPINEKNGDMVTVNFGGKAITGTVEVDEGGKASIYSGGVVYELPNDTEYVDYASPVRISDTDGSIEFDGVSYPEVRIESMDGTETAVLIDENGKPKTVKDPKIVEEFKYQITLANLAEITEEEAITLLSEYEQDSKTKVDDATEGGVNQADEQKRSEEDIKLQEAIDEIDLIELIALEELDNADANAKLVEYKPTNSKDTKVYLVKKNADGTVSATLDGKKVRRGAVLSSLSEAYDLQSKESSKKLATKLQEQVNALKADVEAKLFGKAAVAETPREIVTNQTDGKKLFSEPATDVKRIVLEYKKSKGIDTPEGSNITDIDENNSKNIADTFEEMEDNPNDPEVKKSYQALSDETLDQFDFLINNGYAVEIFEGKGEPYKNSQEMLKDLRDNKHLFVLSTEKDFGETPITDKQRAENPLLRDSERKDSNGKTLLVNDVFRFVHDVFGHGERGNSFGAKGEENAWDVHVRMYSPLAAKAMTTETRGQNSWVNFGAHMRNADGSIKKEGDEGYLSPTERPFAPQKMGILPEFAYNFQPINKKDATKESSQQVTQGGEQGSVVQRQRADEGQQKTGERKGDERKAEKPKADRGDSIKQSREEQEKVAPKKDDSKPVGLSPLETKFKETPEALSKDELKEVLDTKRERYKKAIAAIEKGDLEGDALKAKQKAVESLENTIEDLVKRIDSKVSAIESTEAQLKAKKDFIKKYKDDLFDGSLGIAKTPEQMVQAMREDIKFFNAIIDFAYLSIKLKGLKTIEAFKAELEKQLGVKFDKLPQELKDAWNEAKKKVVDEKKQTPTIKQTIKEATEQKTSPEKVATFAEYMAAKYKGMAEGEKIGQKNRFEIIKEAARYVKQAVASDVSRAKINTLINKAVNIQGFDSIKSFAKYVDKLIENQEYYAKVAELEGLAAKLGSKVKADKFGSIAPQIRRMLSINPEHLTEEGIDKYIALAKDLLSGKVADVTNLESTLAQLKAEERQTIEARLTADLMDDAELISLIDTMYKLLGENPSKVLEEGLKEALPKETADDLKRALEKVNNKRAEIMEFITGNKMIKTAKDYAKLVAAVKKYNGALTQLLDAGIISSAQKLALNINPEGKDLSLLEEALKEKLDDFRKSLADQIMTTISSIKNQYLTGGIRAKLFANLSSFDKKAYEPVIKDILTIPKEVLPDLTIDQLDDLFNAVDQLSNGYISPKVMELLEVIESKGYQNSIAKNADPLYDKQVKSDGIYNSKISPFLKSISDFKSGASALADFMKTFDYKEISSFLSDGFTQIYGEYIYKPFERAFTTYKNVLEDVSMNVVKADDAIKYNKAGNTLRNVVGIFLIQADHLRNPEYKNWSEDKKNLPKYILGEYKNRKANISQKDIELLEAAMNSIEGDISTRQGLDDAMNKYFAKNPKAKNLHTAIRNSIDNNIAPMTKIAIEREGGFFDPDQDYFPIQRRGTAIQESENPFEDLSEKQYSKDFKRRANATYRRIGDPFVMRDFNATSAFNNLAEEASRNYALKPVINPYNRAIDELVARYDKEGKKDLSIFLEASKDVIHTSMKMQFQREQATRYSKFLQESMSYMRGYLLAQVWRLVPDLVSNVSKAMTSMNPIEYAKYAYKQKQAFDNDSFTNLARLTSSPVIFKTSRAKMENLYSNKRIREKKLDTLAGWADVLAATTTWKALMMKNFKEITGKDLDVERLKNDADAYYLENEEALDKAAYRSDLEIDKRFVTQSEIGRAPMQKILPFLGSGENLKGYTVERTSKTFSMLNMMASYMANDARVLGAASRRLITKGDVKGFTRDVTPILLSQAVYAASISYASALASTAGYAIMSIGGDDDDEILAYFTEEINNANKIFTDPQEFAKAYAASLTMMAVGRYMAMSKIAAAFGIGIYASLDVLFAEDKKEKKEDIKKWKENFSVIKDQFYFSPITYGIKDKSIQTTGLDVLSITPVLSFYNRELEKQFTPDKSGSVLGAMKELGKKGGDDNLIGMGVLNLGMLVAIRAGAVFAPSFIKTINEANKTKARKDWEENKKKGGKSNQTKNPFGSSGFGSGGLKGGL